MKWRSKAHPNSYIPEPFKGQKKARTKNLAARFHPKVQDDGIVAPFLSSSSRNHGTSFRPYPASSGPECPEIDLQLRASWL